MFKKAFIHHPIGLALVTFIIGLVVMWLTCKGIIPVPVC